MAPRPAVTTKYSASAQLSSPSSGNYVETGSRIISGGDSIFGSFAPAPSYDGQSVYYTTESAVYYTTTPHSYYAEPIYYSTEQPPTTYSDGGESAGADSPYTYVDASTYFGEDSSSYTGPASSSYTGSADNAGYVSQTVPAANVAQPAAIYDSVGYAVQQESTTPVYYTENVPINNGEPGNPVGNYDNVYGAVNTDVGSDYYYTTTVPPPVYYTAEQAATISPFVVPADVQYGP